MMVLHTHDTVSTPVWSTAVLRLDPVALHRAARAARRKSRRLCAVLTGDARVAAEIAARMVDETDEPNTQGGA